MKLQYVDFDSYIAYYAHGELLYYGEYDDTKNIIRALAGHDVDDFEEVLLSENLHEDIYNGAKEMPETLTDDMLRGD